MTPRRGRSPRSAGPRVSVVIPTFQRRALVAAAVASLRRQTVAADDVEIVVVVDGSTDGTAAHLRSHASEAPLIVVEQENRGRGAAINAGAARASGDILLLLDDDMRADPRMIAEHLRAYEELDADAVMGLVEHGSNSPVNVISDEQRREFERDVREWGTTFGPLPDNRRLVAAQFSVRRELFASVGGYDEAFTRRGHYGHADDDLGIRLRAMGARIVLNGMARSSQTFVRGFDSVWRQYSEYGGADVRLARKHPSGERPERWSLPRTGLARAIAVGTVRYPNAARAAGNLVRPLARALHDRGRTSRLVRKVTYSLLFHHRYWIGVAAQGGGREIGIRGPDPRLLVLAYRPASALPGDDDRGAADGVLAHITALARDGWEIVTPEDVATFLDGLSGLPLRSLLVTLDDASEDVAGAGVSVTDLFEAEGIAYVTTESNPASPGDGSTEPRFLAYADGDWEPGDAAAAALAGYRGAFTTQPGLVGAESDRFRLPRVAVALGTSPGALVRRAQSLMSAERRRRVVRRLSSLFHPARRRDAGPGGRPPIGARGDGWSPSG